MSANTIKSRISMIAACDCNGVIGNDGKMLWHLPEDLEFFIAKTLGKPIINGYISYRGLTEESNHPFVDQLIVVLTRRVRSTENSVAPKDGNIIFVNDAFKALKIADNWAQTHRTNEIMILGGGQIYSLYLPYADRIYLTEIAAHFEGNVFFPKLDPDQWKKIRLKSVQCAFKLNFTLYERR